MVMKVHFLGCLRTNHRAHTRDKVDDLLNSMGPGDCEKLAISEYPAPDNVPSAIDIITHKPLTDFEEDDQAHFPEHVGIGGLLLEDEGRSLGTHFVEESGNVHVLQDAFP